MATTQAALTEEVRAYTAQDRARPRRRIDLLFVLGLVVALGAIMAGVAAAGISVTYFFQPAGALIVIGGTLGVMLVTTPKAFARPLLSPRDGPDRLPGSEPRSTD